MDETEILRKTSTSAYKVLGAMRVLSRGEPGPFAASISMIRNITGLTDTTISSARYELVHIVGVVRSAPNESYVLENQSLQNSPLHTPEGVPTPSRKRLKPYLKKRVVASRKREDSRKLEERRLDMDKHEAVIQACTILGIPRIGKHVSVAQGKLTKRMKDGHTIEEALEVVRWARVQYDTVRRWPKYLNLLYLWGLGMFGEAMAAIKTTPAGPPVGESKGFTTISDPAEREAWRRDFERRAAERGL